MKRFLAIILCVGLLLTFLAGCGSDGSEEESHDHASQSVADPEPSSSEEAHDHNHINYKGLNSKAYTLGDVTAAEGAEPAFSFDANGVTYYAYNNVTLDTLSFTQVQHSFMDDYNRISCTASELQDTVAVYELWSETMSTLYGAPTVSDNGLLRWSDHTGNYITLTQLNDTTVQLCFYFVA